MKTKEEIDEIFNDALQRFGFDHGIVPGGLREFLDTKEPGAFPPPYLVQTAMDHAYKLYPSGGYRCTYAWFDFIQENWK